jgi:transglutaminase/protease-like cytokinesis protein 3
MRLLAAVLALCCVCSIFDTSIAVSNKANSISSKYYAKVQKKLLQNTFRTTALANSASVSLKKDTKKDAKGFAAPAASDKRLSRDAVSEFRIPEKPDLAALELPDAVSIT